MAGFPVTMEQAQFSQWLRQLCGSAVLDLSQLTENQAEFLAALDELGLEYKIDGQILRLRKRIEMLDVDSLQVELARRDLSSDCQYALVTESTNLDVLALLDKQVDPQLNPSIAICEKQNSGKGRRGNHWVSPFGRNIYCTVGLLKSIKPANLGLLSIVTGLALCRALIKLGFEDIKLKWPNDLYHQNKKLGGILIESRPMSESQYYLAIGFGINLDMSDDELAAIKQAATCLNAIASQPVSRNQILLETVDQVQKDIRAFDEHAISQVVEAFDEFDFLSGMPVNILSSGQTIAATNAGITRTGQLQAQTAQGLMLFSAADISLRRA